MAGIITAASISGSLDATNLAMQVLTQANEMSGIAKLFPTIMVPELTCTIPITKPGSVAEDVQELEVTDIETGTFFHVDFSLKKDRVKLAVSDEAQYKSKAGDPLQLQIQATAAELAAILDKKVIAALKVTPQTGDAGDWGTVTTNPLKDFATAVAAIRPYKADFCVMPPATYAEYVATNTIAGLADTPAAYEGAINRVPGYNLPIYIDANCTADTCLVGSAAGMACVIGQGPVKVRQEDSAEIGATVYQMDVFRQVKSTIFKTSGGLNQCLYELTGTSS